VARHRNKTTPSRIKATERAAQALALRVTGLTLGAIAKQLGYRGPQGAADAIERGLRATLQPAADALRLTETERLDALQLALWPAAMQGDVATVDCILRLMARRARLLGLDAPDRVQARVETPLPGTFGVLVVPEPQDEETWERETAKQQRELAELEARVYGRMIEAAAKPAGGALREGGAPAIGPPPIDARWP
jgi:hypothetical protein